MSYLCSRVYCPYALHLFVLVVRQRPCGPYSLHSSSLEFHLRLHVPYVVRLISFEPRSKTSYQCCDAYHDTHGAWLGGLMGRYSNDLRRCDELRFHTEQSVRWIRHSTRKATGLYRVFRRRCDDKISPYSWSGIYRVGHVAAACACAGIRSTFRPRLLARLWVDRIVASCDGFRLLDFLCFLHEITLISL